jgi:hypothetical protein
MGREVQAMNEQPQGIEQGQQGKGKEVAAMVGSHVLWPAPRRSGLKRSNHEQGYRRQ